MLDQAWHGDGGGRATGKGQRQEQGKRAKDGKRACVSKGGGGGGGVIGTLVAGSLGAVAEAAGHGVGGKAK